MSILDKHVERALSGDRSAAFIYGLAVAMPPMGLETVKAASSLFDRATVATLQAPINDGFGVAMPRP